VLVGYSFGSDVLPFIIQRLPTSLRNKIWSTILISPSANTDFEIHVSDIFGYAIKRNMNVAAEINKLADEKIVTVFGDDENDFPVSSIRIKKYTNIILPGGHHFNGDTGILTHTLLKYF
jgi:type IV secretory pathway VirJ component